MDHSRIAVDGFSQPTLGLLGTAWPLEVGTEWFVRTARLMAGTARGRASPKLVFDRRQSPQHFRGPGPIKQGLILTDSSITEDEYAFRELRDVMLVRYKYDR